MLSKSNIAAVLMVLLWWNSMAQGQDSAEADATARIHFKAGTSYYETGDYELALQEFIRAYEMSKRPELQYNMSLTHEKLGDLEEAINALNRYLTEASDIPNRRTLEQRVENLQKRLQQQNEAAQSDSKPSPEPHSAYFETHEEPLITEDEVVEEAAVPVSELSDSTVETQSQNQQTSEEDEVEAPEELVLGLPIEVFTAYAVAGVGTVTFLLFGSLALAEDGSLQEDCINDAGVATCQEDDVSTLKTLSAIADVGLVIGLAAGVVGTVLWFTLEDEEETDTTVTIAPRLGLDQVSATAQVRF